MNWRRIDCLENCRIDYYNGMITSKDYIEKKIVILKYYKSHFIFFFNYIVFLTVKIDLSAV